MQIRGLYFHTFKTVIISAILLSFISCDQGAFFTGHLYMEKIETQFKNRLQSAEIRKKELTDIFENATADEREGLMFLYAFMPLNDLADYSAEYVYENVRIALEARDTFSWGSKIPDEIFMHFVLPYRVNNENPDNFRSSYYKELRDRVIHLSMREAVLELNHWCHEKVTYKSTDSRTSAPLSTIKTAFGRCGEESTFTVAALRTIGIPARQCYTPRWAHCDDNHAWVEAWVDGKWYYLGACEPESELNKAWFTEPARRAMLVHTKVFGLYPGPEEIVRQTPLYTEINVTHNYAKTKKIIVSVVDSHNVKIQGAEVQFRLYNYAEFYPIAQKITDANGSCFISVGLGDLLIWASKDDAFGYKKISVADPDPIIITLNGNSSAEITEDYDFIPPIQPEPLQVSEEGKRDNERRLKLEDQMRGDYEATFITKKAAFKLASRLKIDGRKTWNILEKSRGNWQEISNFMTLASSDPIKKQFIFPLLHAVSEKDLRDTPADILLSHLNNSFKYSGNLPVSNKFFFAKFIMNPRVGNEIIRPYKAFLQEQFEGVFIKKAHKDPSLVKQWVAENIKVNTTDNYYKVPLTPVGVFQMKMADTDSRDIFFVALCRSLGIPARLEPAYLEPQYFSNGQWIDADFEKGIVPSSSKGYIKLKPSAREYKIIPTYYTHFTLERFSKGKYITLDYEEGKKVTDFTNALEVEPGSYLLVTGNRQPDGSVLSRLKFFSVKENETREIPVELRQSAVKPQVYGTIDLDTTIETYLDEKEINLSELVGDKGMIIGWLDPRKEPTRHVLVELAQWKKKFEEWNGTFILFVPKDKSRTSFTEKYFQELPVQRIFAVDKNDELLRIVGEKTGRTAFRDLPVFIVITNTGQIICLSEGYRIGTAELILKAVL